MDTPEESAVALTSRGVRIGLEERKLLIDSIKHITTLATGTIVIIATFMDKLPKPLVAPRDLIASILLMMYCIIISFIMLWVLSFARHGNAVEVYGFVSRKRKLLDFASVGGRLMLDSIYVSFCLSVVSLGVFAAKNISHLSQKP